MRGRADAAGWWAARSRMVLRQVLRHGLVPGLVALGALVPRSAGPAYELKLPVLYAQVRLEQQAPVVLDLALPDAEYTVSPVSLGYFSSAHEFVYTAAVTRGLIYGRSATGPVVVEVVALPEAEQFVENQLGLIRQQVALLNARQNELRSQRQAWPAPATEAQREADQVWQALEPIPGQPGVTRWPAGSPHSGDEAYLSDFGRRLLAQAAQQAELKRLYFATQTARVDLLLRQLDLQLALARLPEPEIAGLLSLGDEQVVRVGCLNEIDRVQQSWAERRTSLQQLLKADQAWAHRLLDQAGAPPAGSSPPLPGIPQVAEEYAGSFISSSDPRGNAEKALVAARLLVEQAEVEELEPALDLIQAAQRKVEQSAKLDSSELPRVAVTPSQLSLSGCENTAGYAAVVASVADWPMAQELLIKLDCSFEARERRDPPPDLNPAWAKLDFALNDVSLGLFMLDQLAEASTLHQSTATHTAVAGDPAGPGQELPLAVHLELIRTVLARPDAYGVASYELGYLRFLVWYGELIQASAKEPQPQPGG